jgi:hypothetical protein
MKPTAMSRSGRLSPLILSAASVLNGVLNAVLIALSSRRGQINEIGAYTVMTAALSLVSIITGGGSSLLYVTGNDRERRSVRSQRIFVVLPCLVVASTVLAAWYIPRGYQASALLTAGLVVIGNNVAELQYGDLARQLRFFPSAAMSCGSKLPAVALLALGVPLTAALAAAAITQFGVAEMLLGKSSWICLRGFSQLSPRDARRALLSNRHLFVYSVAELYNGKIPSLALSMFANPSRMGCFGVVVNVYQAAVSVLYASLQVSMAAKARQRQGIDSLAVQSRSADVFPVAGSVVVAVAVFWLAPWLTSTVLTLPLFEASLWLRILAIALPFCIVNRSTMFGFIADGDHSGARRHALTIAALLTIALAALLAEYGPLGTSSATLFAEGVAALTAAFGASWRAVSRSESRFAAKR